MYVFTDPVNWTNYYLSCMDINLRDTLKREDELDSCLSNIESEIDEKDQVTDMDVTSLETCIAELAIKMHGLDVLKGLILREEEKLIKENVSSSVIDSVRMRREPVFQDYDGFVRRVSAYDSRVESVYQKMGLTKKMRLIQEIFLEINASQTQKYDATIKKIDELIARKK